MSLLNRKTPPGIERTLDSSKYVVNEDTVYESEGELPPASQFPGQIIQLNTEQGIELRVSNGSQWSVLPTS